MENPDLIPYNEKYAVGYCIYDPVKSLCKVLDGSEACETNCCTESRFYGIN